MNKILTFIGILCFGCHLCNAQSISVQPDTICAGESATLTANASLTPTPAVNIGDIICVVNSTSDTIIVSPIDWTNYSSTHTALSVVFFVDSTGEHGWAVKVDSFELKKWNKSTSTRTNIVGVQNFRPTFNALHDMDGKLNTSYIRSASNYSNENYPAVSSISEPFYLPAIGQLNILYPTIQIINPSLRLIDNTFFIDTSKEFWSSTEGFGNGTTTLKNNSLSISINGISEKNKTTPLFVLPVMDF